MTQNYHFRNLIFEGGGVKGIAYVGALRQLQQRGVLEKIQRVGGTSAGAINAVLLSTGHTLDETEKVLSNLDFNNFMDGSWGVARDTKRLIKEFGWYKGDFFRDWMGEIIKDKVGNSEATFNDFKNKGLTDLFLVGTNLSTGFTEVFSSEHTPREPVVDAVRVSMSLPLFFAAIRNKRKDVYVDGGVLRNYPIKIFDREKYVDEEHRIKNALETSYYAEENDNKPETSSKYVFNKETLGFRLESKQQISMFRDGAEPPHAKIEDFFDYGWALVKTLMNAQENNHLHGDDWQRTVYIDTLGVGTTDFDLTDERKAALVESGDKGVKDYFAWYDQSPADDLPANHPDFDG